VLRSLLWRLLGLLAALIGAVAIAWLSRGGPGRALRGAATSGTPHSPVAAVARTVTAAAGDGLHVLLQPVRSLSGTQIAAALVLAALVVSARGRARHQRRYVRLAVEVYRTDRASAAGVANLFQSLHERFLSRWWRRLLCGQPSIALEVHHTCSPEGKAAWLAVCCPRGGERLVESALRASYPNTRLRPVDAILDVPAVLRLKKGARFIKRAKALDHFEQEREPPVDRLITAMAATDAAAFVQIALRPAPILFERLARRLHRDADRALSPHAQHVPRRPLVDEQELRAGLALQHSPLFFCDLRVISDERRSCELIASELRAGLAENRLIERGTAFRHGLLGLYRARVRRGEANPLPALRRGVWAASELARLWHLPSSEYAVVPFRRSGVPCAPASPAILRPRGGGGRCATSSARCRSIPSCAGRTRPFPERWTRASPAI
jgi:hypothetical protein